MVSMMSKVSCEFVDMPPGSSHGSSEAGGIQDELLEKINSSLSNNILTDAEDLEPPNILMELNFYYGIGKHSVT